jgi:hypothetical protein
LLASRTLDDSAFESARSGLLEVRSGRSDGRAGGRTDFLPLEALWEAELFAGGIEDRLGLECLPLDALDVWAACERLFFGGGAFDVREDRGVLFVGIFTS